jgi:DNA-binding CsgD family transcriptional regulator
MFSIIRHTPILGWTVKNLPYLYCPKIPCTSTANVFTPHEVHVLKYFLKENSAKEIALLNSVTAKTIEFHLARIKEKLNRRSQIYQAAILHGFIHLIFE